MTKQSKPRTVSLTTTIFLVFLGIIIGILGTYYINIYYNNAGVNNGLSGTTPMPQNQQCDAVTITNPTKGQKITSPITVTAIVENANKKCQWVVFEGQAAYMELKDATGNILGTGNLITTDDWMTNQAVTYTGDISFDETQATPHLVLILHEDDPSSQSQKQITLPLSY